MAEEHKWVPTNATLGRNMRYLCDGKLRDRVDKNDCCLTCGKVVLFDFKYADANIADRRKGIIPQERRKD